MPARRHARPPPRPAQPTELDQPLHPVALGAVGLEQLREPVVVDGRTEAVSGTSCASPTFASVVALLNDRLLAAGKSPLGFLNPFLYSTGSAALNDVTSGSNSGCFSSGFSAKAGWDPVTGLGTPNFEKLLAAVGL